MSTFVGSISGDYLANTVIGGPTRNVGKYGFRVPQATTETTIKLFLVFSAGYGLGTYGQPFLSFYQVVPGGTDIYLGGSFLSGGVVNYPTFTFDPITFQPGVDYYMLISNVDPRPDLNYFSIDSMFSSIAPPPYINPNNSHSFIVAGGAVTQRTGYQPIFSFGGGYSAYWFEVEQGPLFQYTKQIWTPPVAATLLNVYTTPGPLRQLSVSVPNPYLSYYNPTFWQKYTLNPPLPLAAGVPFPWIIKGYCQLIRKGNDKGANDPWANAYALVSNDNITYTPFNSGYTTDAQIVYELQ